MVLLGLPVAHAQSYPAKPIRVLLPFPPGGGADALMRPLAPKLAELTGQQWIIDNRPGANGNIAAEATANAAPDGYTLFFANSSLVINPSLYSKLPLNVERDFAPITLAAMTPSVLATHPSLPVKTVADLIALARRQPGKLNFASGGAGNTMHLGVELLKSMAKVDMLHVPYKGGGPAIIDVIAGQCDFLVVNIGPVIGHIRGGKLNAVAVTSKARAAVLPNVPTVSASGLPGYESTTWYGFVGPAALPKDVVARVNNVATTVLKNPHTRERYIALGAEPATNTPEQYAAFIRKDMQDWAKVVKVSGARLEHAQFLMDIENFPDIDRIAAEFPSEMMIDHMGRPDPGKGVDAPGFQALIRALKSGRVWTKLSAPYRTSRAPIPYDDLTPFAQALVAAAPDRLVFGTDWPHVMMEGEMPNTGALVEQLAAWVPGAEVRAKILVNNPARLYRF